MLQGANTVFMVIRQMFYPAPPQEVTLSAGFNVNYLRLLLFLLMACSERCSIAPGAFSGALPSRRRKWLTGLPIILWQGSS
jgi:hypothetical protein